MLAPTMESFPPLTKKEKGRLKKLRRRSLEVKKGCETSGLSSNQDWLEWKRLQQLSGEVMVVGPSVRLRKGRPDDCCSVSDWPGCEGIDHMYLLCRFLFEYGVQSENKKRKRSSCSIPRSVPSWATLHNPASTDSVAVIEIHLKGIFVPWDDVINKLGSVRNLLSKDKTCVSRRAVLPMRTRWFQGSHPRSMSDSLLYFPIKGDVSRKDKMNGDNTLVEDTLSLLSDLLLKPEQLANEGYPKTETAIHSKHEWEEKISLKLNEGHLSCSLEEAKELVNKLKVPVIEDTITCYDSPDTSNDEHYVRTLSSTNCGRAPRVFGLDCEMVKTVIGSELARITLVRLNQNEAEQGNAELEHDGVTYTLVMDELVKPERPVLDYLTNYSGVAASSMEPVRTRIQQIQVALLCHVREDDILVGHSLENDLRAVRLVHNKVVDTAVLFQASSGRKYSLRHLSATLLGKKIQTGAGHCSEEDATAALNLAIRRARVGPSFRISERRNDRTNLFQALQQEQGKGTMVCVGPSDWICDHVTNQNHSAHALACETVHHPNGKAVQSWLTSETRKAFLVYASYVLDNESDNDMKKLNENLSVLIERISPGTIVLVAMQQGFAYTSEAWKRRRACKDPRSTTSWSITQEEEWNQTVDQSRSGVAFWIGIE